MPWAKFPTAWAGLLQQAYHYRLKDLTSPEDDGSFLRAIQSASDPDALQQLWQEASEADREAHETAFLERMETVA